MLKIRFSLALSFLAFFLAFYLSSGYALAEERILDYRSDIIVNEDSSMTVNETIQVWCEGNNIIHGIYRDFPTKYKDDYNNRIVVGFEVLEVLKDHQPENYRVEGKKNGKRVYIGKEDITLETNKAYTYTIKYKTTRQLGYFKDHDELYWNVTGNGWEFQIEQVRATVTLPDGITKDSISLKAFTGKKGEKGENYYSFIDEETNKSHFSTTTILQAEEGLTIVVAFPKGFVKEPTREEKLAYILKDNQAYIFGIAGLIAVFLLYILIWSGVGKDLPRGTIIPLYEPPQNFSPAVLRYVHRMGYDNKIFSSTLINMAVKRYIKITRDKNDYSLERLPLAKLNHANELTPEEVIIDSNFFTTGEVFELKQTYHSEISKTIASVSNYLNKHFSNKYFKTNTAYLIPGILISISVFIWMAYSIYKDSGVDSIVAFILGSIFSSVGLSLFLFCGFPGWKALFQGIGSRVDALQNSLIFTIIGLAFAGFGLFMLFYETPGFLGLIVALIVFINILFYHLLKAPTLPGRKLLDQIDGFRMFLSVAEKDRLNLLNPPERTPELFEKYLPYALALDVEQHWSEQFTDILKKAGEDKDGYSPSWFSGGDFHSLSTGAFAASLGSAMASTISSSSSAPGSSSGSGGSSGGGGGGGGGGGW